MVEVRSPQRSPPWPPTPHHAPKQKPDLNTVADDKLDRVLDDWHARIDQLKVQVDLATMDVREDVAKRLEVTENVYLAVRSRLADARRDAGKEYGHGAPVGRSAAGRPSSRLRRRRGRGEAQPRGVGPSMPESAQTGLPDQLATHCTVRLTEMTPR